MLEFGTHNWPLHHLKQRRGRIGIDQTESVVSEQNCIFQPQDNFYRLVSRFDSKMRVSAAFSFLWLLKISLVASAPETPTDVFINPCGFIEDTIGLANVALQNRLTILTCHSFV